MDGSFSPVKVGRAEIKTSAAGSDLTDWGSGSGTRSKRHNVRVAMRILPATVGILLFAVPTANAGFFTPTYTETVGAINSQIGEVMKAHGLSGSDSTYALTAAAAWFYLWPCKGSQIDIPKADGFDVTQTFSLASPMQPTGAAMLEIAAILIREGDGRTQNPQACQFAKDTVISNTR
jgi:hypothetical protein